mgnify:CR=1 FL=1
MSDHAAHVRATMRPLPVADTGMVPKLPRFDGIRTVVFDLYGTLLVSDAGGGSHERERDPEGLPGFERVLQETVRAHQDRLRSQGAAHPEVEIRGVWAEALAATGRPAKSREEIETLVLRHECGVNPVWPMPYAAEALAALRGAGFVLGIVSNAQFYTLPVMEGLFGASLDGLGFHPGLRVFSFEEGEGKPSPRLFALLRERAAALGIAPEEVFYLGNDLQKDVLPAREAGFRTGLFAGDARSLRLGGVSEQEATEIADAVITGLDQVPGLF